MPSLQCQSVGLDSLDPRTTAVFLKNITHLCKRVQNTRELSSAKHEKIIYNLAMTNRHRISVYTPQRLPSSSIMVEYLLSLLYLKEVYVICIFVNIAQRFRL